MRADEDVQAGTALRGRSLALLPLASPGPPSAQTGPWQVGQMVVDSLGVYWTWNGSLWLPVNGGPVRIAKTVLSAAAANVIFSNISPVYETLEIFYQARDTSAATSVTDFNLQFNGDTGATYSANWTQNNNATVQAFQSIAGTSGHVGATVNGGALATSAGHGRITIPNYAGTTFSKNWETLVGMTAAIVGTSLWTQFASGIWNNSAAINQIAFICGNGNFAIGSTFTLFGYP